MTTGKQHTHRFILIEPNTFGFNVQTAATNVFQNKTPDNLHAQKVTRDRAMSEFKSVTKKLTNEELELFILPSPTDSITPDAVFPNNWISFYEGGVMVLHPMLAPNRRKERQTENVLSTLKKAGISISKTFDYTSHEKDGHFLEGTGSVVLDRINKVAYAVESARTSKKVFEHFCKDLGYTSVFFHGIDNKFVPVYHTNVLMSIGDKFAVICLEAIADVRERDYVKEMLEKTGRTIITITLGQMFDFCANILEVVDKKGSKKIILSETAYESLTEEERKKLSSFGKLVPLSIPTIESVGGGSARCLVAEIF